MRQQAWNGGKLCSLKRRGTMVKRMLMNAIRKHRNSGPYTLRNDIITLMVANSGCPKKSD